MPSNIIKIDPFNPDPEALAYAGEFIRQGKIVAFPTETVYGLGANALDENAVRKVYTVKKRPSFDPAIVHLASIDQLSQIAKDIPDAAHCLAKAFWPGGLTLVLSKQEIVPDCVTASMPTVGVRVPSHAIAAGLLRAAGVPIAAPSANLFTRTTATTAAHVLADLGDTVDLIIDAGEATIGIESTVISVTTEEVRLLRPGAISWESIQDTLTSHGLILNFATGSSNKSASPGLAQKHYSPRARVLFFRGPADETRSAVKVAVTEELSKNQSVGLLLTQEDIPNFEEFQDRVKIEDLGSETDLATVAHRLYAAMRHLDELQVDTICVRSFGTGGLAPALLDRLTRAAEGRIIDVS
jgi:L-threonylcarbamoyladenylate synthase